MAFAAIGPLYIGYQAKTSLKATLLGIVGATPLLYLAFAGLLGSYGATEIADIIFEQRKESNPCSLCAKMRKGALNQAVKEMGCNKVAYAHHKDDIIETMLLSLIFEGRFHSFSPPF